MIDKSSIDAAVRNTTFKCVLQVAVAWAYMICALADPGIERR